MRYSLIASLALTASLVVAAQASKYEFIIEDRLKKGTDEIYTKYPVLIFTQGQEPRYKIEHMPDTHNGLSTYATYDFGTGKALFLVHSLDTVMTVNIIKNDIINDEQINIDVGKQVDIEASGSTKGVQNSYRFLLSQKMYVCRPSAKVEIENLKPLIECFVEGSDAVVASLNEVRPKPDTVVAALDAIVAADAVIAARDAVVAARTVVDTRFVVISPAGAAARSIAATDLAAHNSLVTAHNALVAKLDNRAAPAPVATLGAVAARVVAALNAAVAALDAFAALDAVAAPDAAVAALNAVVAALNVVVARNARLDAMLNKVLNVRHRTQPPDAVAAANTNAFNTANNAAFNDGLNEVIVVTRNAVATLNAVVAALNAVIAPDAVVTSNAYLIEIKQPTKLTEEDKNTLVQLLPLFKLRQKSESKSKENLVALVPSSSCTHAQFIRNDVPQTWRQAWTRELPEIWDEIRLTGNFYKKQKTQPTVARA